LRVFPKVMMRKIALHPDGQHVLGAGGKSRMVNVWDLKANKLVLELEGHGDDVTGVAISPGGRIVVSCGRDGAGLVWNIQNLQAPLLAYAHYSGPEGDRFQFEDCAFTPDGKTVYLVGPKAGLHVLDVYSGKATVIELKGKALAVSSTGKFAAVGGS